LVAAAAALQFPVVLPTAVKSVLVDVPVPEFVDVNPPVLCHVAVAV
jgi:hypothetical protein